MLENPQSYLGAAKKTITSLLLVAMGVFAIASMGGGGNKSKEKAVRPEFTPIRTTNGFTLKAGPVYRGSVIFGQEKSKSMVAYNSVATYQKGNTIYILPVKYKVQATAVNPSSSSLQLFNLKIKIHK